MKKISIADVEFITFRLTKELIVYDEPIPDFSTRFPNILESCLLAPFQEFAKKPLYQGLVSQAAILFYLMIKNHPFQNGNKRIALTSLLVLLYRNKRWLKVDNKKLYDFTMQVTASPGKSKKETVQTIEHFLKSYLVDL
ncbi:MAG: type II toxin-antitoxin system death-on-curing family toxin [Candidatus Portnoybacteria bacterium]|nr:type II toxin-antitoxin system death-on-curing family toxin [Candidatus Portnoybacteria bacterium]